MGCGVWGRDGPLPARHLVTWVRPSSMEALRLPRRSPKLAGMRTAFQHLQGSGNPGNGSVSPADPPAAPAPSGVTVPLDPRATALSFSPFSKSRLGSQASSWACWAEDRLPPALQSQGLAQRCHLPPGLAVPSQPPRSLGGAHSREAVAPSSSSPNPSTWAARPTPCARPPPHSGLQPEPQDCTVDSGHGGRGSLEGVLRGISETGSFLPPFWSFLSPSPVCSHPRRKGTLPQDAVGDTGTAGRDEEGAPRGSPGPTPT